MTPLKNSFLSKVVQVCVVTRDIDRTIREYADRLGIGPWQVHTLAPPHLVRTKLRGKECTYSMKMALAFIGDMMWELVQPLRGPTIYDEFLATHGEGIHHIAYSNGD